MAQDVTADGSEDLKHRYLLLRRQFEQLVPTVSRARRQLSEMQALAAWALRAGPNGWAMVRQGGLKITNRRFDAFDRGTAIGPGWCRVAADGAGASDDGSGHRLAAIVVEEARQLIDAQATSARCRFTRGRQVIEVTVERGAAGRIEDEAVLVTVRDISAVARTEAELAAARVRLLEKERTGLAGSMAIGVAHDLGNLVGALSAQVMTMKVGQTTSNETLQTMKAILDAQVALVGKLRALATAAPVSPEPLGLLDDVVRPALQMVEVWLREREPSRAVRTRADGSLSDMPRIMGLRDELVNLVINLIVNARDAMPDGGLVTLSAEKAGDVVILRVDDEGSGIAEDQLDRIFEPFYSTKGTGGMGMGLAMARQIMRRLGGAIAAHNRREGGARFELTFQLDRGDEPVRRG